MAEYIDRHALKNDGHLCWHDGKGNVFYEVDHAPTADVVEVMHGEWVVTKMEHGWNCAEYPTEFTCSVCGRTEPKEEPFCHCGAKMDGKDGAAYE